MLALRGVTNKYALQSWRKIPPPPHVIVVGLLSVCAHTGTLVSLGHRFERLTAEGQAEEQVAT